MKVVRAANLGMCFGVREALALAASVPDPANTTILGELVHNRQVMDDLRQRGFAMLAEEKADAIPRTAFALVPAHGMSDARRERLHGTGKHLIDATCPLVMRVASAARELAEAGCLVILVGRRGHVEVRGVMEDHPEGVVVESAGEVRNYGRERLGVVCQTTARPDEAAAVLREIRRLNPASQIDYRETICAATRRRVQGVVELLNRVEGLVVVGGRNSNNTRGLAALGAERGKPVWLVERAEELRPEAFRAMAVVGLAAGASTPDRTIDEVHEALSSMGRDATEAVAEAG